MLVIMMETEKYTLHGEKEREKIKIMKYFNNVISCIDCFFLNTKNCTFGEIQQIKISSSHLQTYIFPLPSSLAIQPWTTKPKRREKKRNDAKKVAAEFSQTIVRLLDPTARYRILGTSSFNSPKFSSSTILFSVMIRLKQGLFWRRAPRQGTIEPKSWRRDWESGGKSLGFPSRNFSILISLYFIISIFIH